MKKSNLPIVLCCFIFGVVCSARINNTPLESATDLQLSNIVKNSDGTIRNMVESSIYARKIIFPPPKTGLGAQEYCQSIGQRLPTARELAQWSIGNGAKGIIEYDKYNNELGYFLVDVVNPDGVKDRFYFNAKGYLAPSKDVERNIFWSSSITWLPSGNNSYSCYFNGQTGGFGLYGFRASWLPVMCVVGR